MNINARIYILAIALSAVNLLLFPSVQVTAESEDEYVVLDKSMNIVQLIEAASKIDNETYVLDESVTSQEINIITPEGNMKRDDFINYLDSILNLNGISIVKSDGINKVISSSRIKEENTPTVIQLGEE